MTNTQRGHCQSPPGASNLPPDTQTPATVLGAAMGRACVGDVLMACQTINQRYRWEDIHLSSVKPLSHVIAHANDLILRPKVRQCIQALLASGYDPFVSEIDTLNTISAWHPHILQCLLSSISLAGYRPAGGGNILHMLAQHGCQDFMLSMKSCLRYGEFDPNERNSTGDTALMSLWRNTPWIFKGYLRPLVDASYALFRFGADLGARDAHGTTCADIMLGALSHANTRLPEIAAWDEMMAHAQAGQLMACTAQASGTDKAPRL